MPFIVNSMLTFRHVDLATIRSWRSKILNALVNCPDFDSHRADRIKQRHPSHKCFAFSSLVLRGRRSNHLYKLQFLNELLSSHIDFGCQLTNSKLKWTPYSNGYSTHGEYSMLDAHQFGCVNLLAGGKIIKFPANERTFQMECITYILDICPGLYCRSVKSDEYSEPKVLKKPKVLVAMAKLNELSF